MFIVDKIVVVILLLPTCERYFLFSKQLKSNGHFWLSHQNMEPELHSLFCDVPQLAGPDRATFEA